MDDKDSKNIKSLKQVLILGGGIAGLSAARELEGWGAHVHLVEKHGYLGGKAFEWACMATDECQNCGACLSAELVDEVENLQNAHVYLETEIKEVLWDKQKIKAKLAGGISETIDVDAILIATGFEPFDPSVIKSLNYIKDERVITTLELNNIIKKENLSGLFARQEAPRIGFIQCVGSRNREQGRDYCSQVCCKVALRQTNKILDEFPNADITVFYMDLQIIGKEFRYRFNQIKDKVKLVQGVPGEILTDNDSGDLVIVQEDEISGERIAHHFDTVVLSVGMVPHPDISDLYGLLDIESDQWGFLKDKDGSHGNGIYSAGTARGPMDILNSQQNGIIAAHNIAQALGILSDPHPSPSVAILGEGDEGMKVAGALLSQGYGVKFLDLGIHKLEESDNLGYFTNSQLLEVSGSLGNFTILFDSNNERKSIHAAVLVVATGSTHVQRKIEGLDGEKRIVMGLNEFEQNMNSSLEELPNKIVFLLDYLGEEWKDNARRSILMASTLAEQGRDIFILIKKVLVNGFEGQRIYDSARKYGVKFLRVSESVPPSFSRKGESIEITMNEVTLGNVSVNLQCDLLIIPELIQAVGRNSKLGNILSIEQDRENFLQSSNIRHRLISSPRRGIFFFGSCHDEIDEDDMKEEIFELKSLLAQIQERSPNTFNGVAQIDEKLCARCLTCFRTCPHVAVILRDQFQPEIIPDACFNCGQCVASCPAGAITEGVLTETLLDERSVAKETVVFMCRRSAALAEREARRLHLDTTEKTRIIPVDCAGSVSIETILAPLLEGAEKVIIAGCHKGNCRSGYGGTFASKQLQRVVRDTGVGDSQLRYQSVAANEPYKLNRILSK
ncbi:FAD-dependent oxidoreductase [Thermodesulfobacteriota bacterium]